MVIQKLFSVIFLAAILISCHTEKYMVIEGFGKRKKVYTNTLEVDSFLLHKLDSARYVILETNLEYIYIQKNFDK